MIRAAHARFVLDASVVAKWFTRHEEPDRDKAIALRALHQSGRCSLVLPEFALLEVLNAIRYSARAGEEDAIRALGLLEKLRLDIIHFDWDLLRRATAIAWACQVPLYDSAYVALAERLGVPFLTADDTMARKMKGRGAVIRLAEMDRG
jgi:predicted nucleic acid-binding protein